MFIAILIMCGAFLELLFAIAFSFWVRTLVAEPLPIEDQHSTWIVLSVRGFDPTLERGLHGLLSQTYGDYRVCVVVDHKTDPAWDAIEQIKSDHPHGDRLLMRVLEQPLTTCSLKCSAMAEAVEFILASHPETQKIVLVDSDVNPHPTMLAEVTGPLSDPAVGVVSGSQWFEPEPDSSLGTHVRSLWNAGALLLTVYFQNPWAGTFAMRADTIQDTNLIDVWRTSAVDDGPVKMLVGELGLKSRVVPSLFMINRESCTMSFVSRWMSRILTWSRIHEPSFFTTQFNVVVTDLLIIATLLTLAWGCLTLSLLTIAWSLLALITSGVFLILAYAIIRQSVARLSNNKFNGTSETNGMPALTFGRMTKLLLLILPTQVIYTLACWSAMTTKKISWRGIGYSIEKRQLRMDRYVPYSETLNKRSDVSI